jgi:glutaredoxin-like protein DUF836
MSDYYLFGTSGCHLCEEAEQLLQHSTAHVDYCKKDIVDNPDWMEQYGIRIPVLQHLNSQQELSWPFDSEALQQFIQTTR